MEMNRTMDEQVDALIADRNRWRHEYRIEKQKNALMRSDLRAARARIKELEAEVKHAWGEVNYLVGEEDDE